MSRLKTVATVAAIGVVVGNDDIDDGGGGRASARLDDHVRAWWRTMIEKAPPLAGAADHGGPRARASAHWGHWHKIRRISKARAYYLRDVFEDGADALAILAAISIRFPPVAIVSAVGAIGYNRIARALDRAATKARRSPAVRIDVGFKCEDVPVAVDPCLPWVSIRPRL